MNIKKATAPMVQHSAIEGPVLHGIAEFYGKLSGDYDLMTNFAKRFVHEKPFFNMIAQQYGIKSALDAGSGTGFHSILMGQLGVSVTALDLSKRMLERTRVHASDAGLDIETIQSGFLDLPDSTKKKYDAVLCLGNSLPHLLTSKNLEKSVRNFAALLNPGGILLLQLLNYDRILANMERVQSVKEQDGVTFVRFYEFHKDHVVFNILKLRKENGRIEQEIESIKLRPIVKKELVHAVDAAGRSHVRVHGSIAMDDFQIGTSKDLVVFAQKPAMGD